MYESSMKRHEQPIFWQRWEHSWQGIARLNRALCPLMSGVGSRETGLDSLFASKPVGFEPCLGQSAKLAGAPKPLCLSVLAGIPEVLDFSLHACMQPCNAAKLFISEQLHVPRKETA